jgi:hypothetical protein
MYDVSRHTVNSSTDDLAYLTGQVCKNKINRTKWEGQEIKHRTFLRGSSVLSRCSWHSINSVSSPHPLSVFVRRIASRTIVSQQFDVLIVHAVQALHSTLLLMEPGSRQNRIPIWRKGQRTVTISAKQMSSPPILHGGCPYWPRSQRGRICWQVKLRNKYWSESHSNIINAISEREYKAYW